MEEKSIQEARQEFINSQITKDQERQAQYRRYVPKGNSIAQLNRHTGLPHEHNREITRRLKNKIS